MTRSILKVSVFFSTVNNLLMHWLPQKLIYGNHTKLNIVLPQFYHKRRGLSVWCIGSHSISPECSSQHLFLWCLTVSCRPGVLCYFPLIKYFAESVVFFKYALYGLHLFEKNVCSGFVNYPIYVSFFTISLMFCSHSSCSFTVKSHTSNKYGKDSL